jgi:uncharacterized protein YjeT (DUF2065 family)
VSGVALLPPFVVVCALLALAGVLKLRSPQAARDALSTLGVRVPPAAVRILGLAELALGVLAALRPNPATVGLVAFAYAAFGVIVALLVRAEGNADCGCFGAASSVASWAHVALNAAACAVAVAVAFVRPPGLAWIATRAPLVAATTTLGLAAAAFAGYAAFTLFAPAWRAYGSGSEA